VVTVLGPLEAAGLEFDAVWLTGAVATDWPPSARPPALLARALQREYRMPDATPADTAMFAGRVLRRIAGSAPGCIASYPRMIGDAVQLPTRLFGARDAEPGTGDPGWFATHFAGTGEFVTPPDPAPPVRAGERVGGGAGVIAMQSSEPFAAFATGRLRAREVRAYTSGIAPNVRGNLVHAALAKLYADLPDRSELQRWTPSERLARIDAAVTGAYRREERYADDVRRELLYLEKARTAALIVEVIDTDSKRAPFSIAGVESAADAVIGGVLLGLRCDRTDRLPGGSLAILDYKSGNPRKLMGRDGPNDLQLIVYSCIVDAPVAGLGLFVVDCKRLEIDGIGPAFGEAPDWDADLGRWRARVLQHARDLANGDVRLNARQGLNDARALSVLSRYPEVYRGD
jgi:RecB family exonuclease